MRRPSVWLIVKIAILVWTFVGSAIKPLGHVQPLSPSEALTLAAILVPVWALMLNLGQPLRFFHFVAFYSVSMAVGDPPPVSWTA
jgi:hypothetical protein